jgi:hypothetical protein
MLGLIKEPPAYLVWLVTTGKSVFDFLLEWFTVLLKKISSSMRPGFNTDGQHAQTLTPMNKCTQTLLLWCNTVKFLDFKMLIGRIIKKMISHNFKICQIFIFIYRKFSKEDWLLKCFYECRFISVAFVFVLFELVFSKS